MESAFTGIEIGKRSLFAHQRAITTVGHNLSNSSTEGYSRQRVEFAPTEPIYLPQLNREETPGQIGQGVDIARVERVKDELLEGRIVANASGQGYWSERDKYVKQMEQVYNEPSELSVRNLMDRFWDGWQELSQYPEQTAARKQVLERGQSLVAGMQNHYKQLDQIRTVLNENVQVSVKEVNDLTRQIALFNDSIGKAQAEGDVPNDLMDQRDLLVNKLSEYVDVTVDTRNPAEYTIHTAGYMLVQGKQHNEFLTTADKDNEGYLRVDWANSGEQTHFRAGKLAADIEMRDVDVRREVQHLDNMAVNFTDLVNEIHRTGYGANGKTNTDFFEQFAFVENGNGNYDRNGDGKVDASYIFRIGGSNALTAQSPIGLAGTISLSGPQGPVTVDYHPADTVQDLIVRINRSGAEVVARLDREGKLELKGAPSAVLTNPDFVVRSVKDSGQFLVGYAGLLRNSGDAGAYNWEQPDAVQALTAGANFGVAPLAHPAAWMGLNNQVIKDPGMVATSFGEQGRPGDLGDGRAALAISALRNSPVMVGQISTFDDYFADRTAEIGLKGSEAKIALDTQEKIMKDLKDTREGYSGVNMDEELAQMIKFQAGYNAAARFVSEIDKMLDVIINRMGV
jgi:flagellar hook-associated protein 1 FlgK